MDGATLPKQRSLWERIDRLDGLAQATLLKWMVNDRREVGDLEILFSEYRRLSPVDRSSLQQKLMGSLGLQPGPSGDSI
jgi:hypothetical protein